MVRFFSSQVSGHCASPGSDVLRGSDARTTAKRLRCSRHPEHSGGGMSGWLGCCDCLQRRAMVPARQPRSALAADLPPPHGHHNPAFLDDDEVATPSPPYHHQQQLSEDTAGPEGVQTPASPPEERYCDVPKPVRPQFREVCDLRGEPLGRESGRNARGGRPVPSPQLRGSPASPGRGSPASPGRDSPASPGRGSPASPGRDSPASLGRGSPEDRQVPATRSEPFEPVAWDSDWDAERTSQTKSEPAALPQRRASQLDNISETSEANGTAETTKKTGLTGMDARTAKSGPNRGANDGSESASPPRTVRWEDDAGPAADPEGGAAQPDDPSRTAGRARAASLGAPKRLAFPRFRRHSSQRRQSAGGASADRQRSREPSKERSWLRRFSRSKPSGALEADQPPAEQPAAAPAPARNLAAQRWGRVRDDFDQDVPLSEHWGFLQTGGNSFGKIDATSYNEHLHEHDNSPVVSSSSDEDVPSELEAQLMLKLAQAPHIQTRKSPVSRRCEEHARQRRRMERQASSDEETHSAAETNECQKPTPVEEWERLEVSEHPAVRLDSGSEKHIRVELRPEQPGSGVLQCAAGESSPVQRASSCPPPQGDVSPVPSVGRRQRGSIFSRLLALPAGQSRCPSQPAPDTPPTADSPEEVHHPSWFQPGGDAEEAAGPKPDQQALSHQRDTVTELALREFLEEVDEQAHHLEDEEFVGPDPYHQPADDSHVVPLLNAPRCVNLMLADAEKRLEKEYNTPTPSPRRSPCLTPRRSEGAQQRGGPDSRQTAGGGGITPSDKQIKGNSGSRSADRQTAGSSSCRPENRQTAGSSSSCCADGNPQPAEQRDRRDGTVAASEGLCRAQSASAAGGGPMAGGLPAYLTNIQHEMVAAADALRTKLQATLHSSLESRPSSSTTRSQSPPKSARSRSSSQSSDVFPSAPRNSISHPTEQSSSVDTRLATSADLATVSSTTRQRASLPLVGYQQMALAMARQSSVGYQELALALARQQTTAAESDDSPVRCQAVQTSPGIASPTDLQPRAATGQSRAVQTSPGVSTPAEGTAACTQCGACTQGTPRTTQGVASCAQSDSCTQDVPTCTQCGICTRTSPAVCSSLPGAAAPSPAPAAEPAAAEEADSEGPAVGGLWTVPLSDESSPELPAPPARLLAYGQPSWVARQQTSEAAAGAAAELRRQLDSGQLAARRRRDTLLRRRADRAAEMGSSPPGHRPGGDHSEAGLPSRPPARR